MKIVILDAATLGSDVDLSPLKKAGDTTVYDYTLPDEVKERIADANVVVVNKIKLNATNLGDAKELRLICVTATGYDNIDTEYCKPHGIALCNVPAYSTDSVAQVTLSMALSLATHTEEYRKFVNSGEYTRSGVANRLTPVYHEISSMTWGVVGGGSIGSRVASVASAMGCRVLMCRRKSDERYEMADIDRLCEESDIISLHVPLNGSTRNMINKERIAKMKDGVIVINVARGAVADEEALTEAIESGKLGGLGVDVFTSEPFGTEHPYNRILGRENVYFTPHMAWGSLEARNRCVLAVAENISSFYQDKHKNRIV